MGNSERSGFGGSTALEISQKHIEGFGPVNLGLAQEFLYAPNNPQVITAVWRSLLPDVHVPSCKWQAADIAEPVVDINGESHAPLMVPDIADFQGPEGLTRLVKRFSLIDPSNYARLKSVVSYGAPNLFVKIEASIDSPNLYTSEDELRDYLANTGKTGITEQVYILGALFAKLMTDTYFDQSDLTGEHNGTVSDLQGSHDTERKATIHAWFLPEGKILTASPKQRLDGRQPLLGRRTMELPHAA